MKVKNHILCALSADLRTVAVYGVYYHMFFFSPTVLTVFLKQSKKSRGNSDWVMLSSYSG